MKALPAMPPLSAMVQSGTAPGSSADMAAADAVLRHALGRHEQVEVPLTAPVRIPYTAGSISPPLYLFLSFPSHTDVRQILIYQLFSSPPSGFSSKGKSAGLYWGLRGL